jgi:hypothetical protein
MQCHPINSVLVMFITIIILLWHHSLIRVMTLWPVQIYPLVILNVSHFRFSRRRIWRCCALTHAYACKPVAGLHTAPVPPRRRPCQVGRHQRYYAFPGVGSLLCVVPDRWKICNGNFCTSEPGSSVSIVSAYWLDDRAIEVPSPAEAKDFSSIVCVQTGSGAHPASCTMGTGGPFPGAKARPGSDSNHSPPPRAEVENE